MLKWKSYNTQNTFMKNLVIKDISIFNPQSKKKKKPRRKSTYHPKSVPFKIRRITEFVSNGWDVIEVVLSRHVPAHVWDGVHGEAGEVGGVPPHHQGRPSGQDQQKQGVRHCIVSNSCLNGRRALYVRVYTSIHARPSLTCQLKTRWRKMLIPMKLENTQIEPTVLIVLVFFNCRHH